VNDNAIKTALVSRLTGDSTLTTLLGGTAVYDTLAPQNHALPYVVFQKQDGRREYTMGQRVWDTQLYVIKGVTDGASGVLGGSVAARIDSLLDDAPLTISGQTNHVLRHRRDIEYLEPLDGGNRVRHQGAIYEVVIA
jgi:hypothetical protein